MPVRSGRSTLKRNGGSSSPLSAGRTDSSRGELDVKNQAAKPHSNNLAPAAAGPIHLRGPVHRRPFCPTGHRLHRYVKKEATRGLRRVAPKLSSLVVSLLLNLCGGHAGELTRTNPIRPNQAATRWLAQAPP